MALAYAGIIVELKEILLKSRPQELFDVSKKGTVPVLCLSNSVVIDESLDIMHWALNQKDTDFWINNNIKLQHEIIIKYDIEFKYWLDRYKYYDRYPKNTKKYYREKCSIYLTELNFMLKNNLYILSNQISFVDIAIFPFIRQFTNVDIIWLNKNYNKISQWLNNIIQSRLFLSVMNKYPEYNYMDKPLIIDFNKK